MVHAGLCDGAGLREALAVMLTTQLQLCKVRAAVREPRCVRHRGAVTSHLLSEAAQVVAGAGGLEGPMARPACGACCSAWARRAVQSGI
jgi:hypothetical protein